jgi:malate dehydrogenase (quinone)
MLNVGLDNFDLVKYLISQVMLSDDDRFAALKSTIRRRRKTGVCGRRVSACRSSSAIRRGGVLRLGTEVVSDKEGTIAALLGASPGASTAAPIMLHLMEKVFKDKVASRNGRRS